MLKTYKFKLNPNKTIFIYKVDKKWVYSQTIQDVTDRLDKSYQSFFRGGGFPKFAKRGLYSSFAFKQGVGICENTNKIKLPSLGKISFRRHRDIPSETEICQKYLVL